MTRDEIHHCPACRRHTRHVVVRERVLAPVLWCQQCFNCRVEHDDAGGSMAQPPRRDAAA